LVLRRYVLEIQQQCDVFEVAMKLLNADLAAMDGLSLDDVPEWRRSFTSAWIHIQAILTAAAALSRFFWPRRGTKRPAPRHEELREEFGLTGESILADRTVRDSFEHFDERIDRFLTGDEARFRASLIIGKRESWDGDGMVLVRLFDPESREVYILGEVIRLDVLADAVSHLAAQAARVRQAT
jgi:hypothetical protein